MQNHVEKCRSGCYTRRLGKMYWREADSYVYMRYHMERWEEIMNYAISIRTVEKLTSKKYDIEKTFYHKSFYSERNQ